MNKTFHRIMSAIMTLALTLGSYYTAQASPAAVPALAANSYYVSATGNDANAGTLASPYKTISKGISKAVAGDTVYVRAGTYPTFSISKSGIVVSGYNGEMPLISGGIGIRCYNASNVTIKGFEVTGVSGNYIGAIMLDKCNNVIIQGNKVHDNTSATVTGITVSGSDNKILNNEVFNNNYTGIRISGTSLNNEIAFNKVYNHTLSAGDSDGIDIAVSSATNTNIHDNTVFGNSDDGIDTWVSPGNIIKNNVTYGNGGTGDGNGIKLGSGGNNTVTGNISYSNETCGFTSNGAGNYYENNTAYNNGTCGFSDDWRVANNTQKSSFINNRAYSNPTGNFRTLAKYLTVFMGNLETQPGATTAVTSTPITVASPTPTPVVVVPTKMATLISTQIPFTPTASAVPVQPTATQIITTPLTVANTYYVSVTGNDANAGTLASPYKTISKAMNMVQSGGTIYVRAGTYPTFSIAKSGITVSGYNGEMPLISGGIGIRCYNASNVTIKGFEVTGVSGNYIGAIMLDKCSNVVVQGNKVHDNTSATVSGITVSGSNNKILNNEVFNNNYTGIRISGTSLNNEIGYNKVYNHTLSAADSDGIDITVSSVTNTNIHDNTVFGNSDDGIDTWVSPGNIIKNNVTYGNGGTGDGNGIKLGGNTNGGNNTVTGNISYSNETCGFTSNGNGNYYESNTAYNNGGCGFSDDWRVSGNTQMSSFINNRAYSNTTGNFKTMPQYLTTFIGNLETQPGATAVASPTFTSTAAVPTIAVINTATAIPTQIPFTPTASAVPVLPTATQTTVPTVISPPTSIPATSSGGNGVNIRVAKGSDDVEEDSAGVISTDSSDLELIYDHNAQVIGIRFTGVTIPQGATITNAYIQFKVDETSSTTVKLTIAAEASANASAFSTAARNVSARPRTSSSVSWTPLSWTKAGDMGAAQQTPNLKSIIQEIVSLPKWTSGNSIVMIITGSGGKRVAESYEGNAAGAPLLHIEYSMQALKAAATPTVTATPTLMTPLASPTILPVTFTPVPTQIQVTPTATEVIIPTGTAVPSSPTLEVIIPTETPVPVTP